MKLDIQKQEMLYESQSNQSCVQWSIKVADQEKSIESSGSVNPTRMAA